MEQETICPTGKVYYPSPQKAAKAKKALARRRNADPHKNLNHYPCHICDGYHLGRPRQNVVFKSMRAKKPGGFRPQHGH